jgi:hypothetical protein
MKNSKNENEISIIIPASRDGGVRYQSETEKNAIIREFYRLI